MVYTLGPAIAVVAVASAKSHRAINSVQDDDRHHSSGAPPARTCARQSPPDHASRASPPRLLSAREPRPPAVPPRRKAVAQTILYPTIARRNAKPLTPSSTRLADSSQRALAARHLQGGLLPGHLQGGRARRPGLPARDRRALPEARSHEAVGLRRERQHARRARGVLELRAEAEREDRRRPLMDDAPLCERLNVCELPK